jgi:predicted dehydrogenase
MTARPRVALVGAGQMGAMHARVLAQSLECELVRIVEPRRETGRTMAEKYGVAWSPDFDSLDGIDAVVIAAATETHFGIAKRILALGRPLLVEKPLTLTYQQSAELVEESERRGLPIMCGLLERFNPAVLTARQFVHDVVQINAIRHSPFVPRISTGVATDLLIHDVDLAIRFIGEAPDTVKGSFGYFHPPSKQNHSEDSADTTMSFRGGAMATISASRISQRKIRQLSILEIDRLVELDLLRRDITIYRHVADRPSSDGVGGYQQQTVIEIPTILQSTEPLAAQLSHFLRLLELGAGSAEVRAEREAILPAHQVIHEVSVSADGLKPAAARMA